MSMVAILQTFQRRLYILGVLRYHREEVFIYNHDYKDYIRRDCARYDTERRYFRTQEIKNASENEAFYQWYEE